MNEVKIEKCKSIKWWPQIYFDAESKNYHNKSFFTKNTNNIPENIVTSVHLSIRESNKVFNFVEKRRENCENTVKKIECLRKFLCAQRIV